MPCTICGDSGHNRRTCQQWQFLEARRRSEQEVLVADAGVNNIADADADADAELSYYIPSTRNRAPATPPTRRPLNPPARRPINPPARRRPLNDIMPRSLVPDLENINFSAIFADTDSDLESSFDDMPGLMDVDDISGDEDTNLVTKHRELVPCVEEPCPSDECPICMDSLQKTDLFVSRCGHQFHGTCMVRHMKQNDNCPMCRGILFTCSV
jgi:hypothetical protein